MKVLFWSETFWPRVGGVERLAAALLPALRGLGHEFAIVTWVDDTVTELRFEDMTVHRYAFFAGAAHVGIGKLWAQVEAIRRLKRSFAPDLVHVNSCGRSAWYHLATGAEATPTLVTLHQPLAGAPAMRESVAGRLLASASRVICCSRAVADTVHDALPAARTRVGVIANALPAPPSPPAVLLFDPPQIVYVGRLVPEKGLDAVLDALAPLFALFPGASLTVAGEGPLRAPLEARVATLGLSRQVRFLGAVPPHGASELLRNASIVIVPSRIEGFGLVALEAAQLGRPVVATRVGGLPEVVRHESTGLLVAAGDSAGFAHAVARLLCNPAEARRMGARAQVHAASTFSWRTHVQAYDALYRDLFTTVLPRCVA